ncbi:serine/threonine-protein kinase [Streptomyces malaysiensis]|uniref:non-specific serine/threonine protein kinase n=1 Tax=Streptomyces malaysiensis subsp. samsunensis TaxID=459658 RepID=A0A9X2LY14_STRMQ|nr:serine/threonine-protein kinase [Streptomyces samsunensis]MCQ8831727.1 serine/threonine protein kinase [Streptomyces samsunensis]
MRADREGAVLGDRYRLERPLGRGNMGRVWKGTDLRLGRAVAVKTVIMDAYTLADERDRERLQLRFEREARAAARLDSANVATVYDADVSGDLRWLAMQLVDGATLGELLDEWERLDTTAAVAVAAQICSGLAAAHAAGLVHRDIKPENVMVRRDGVVKILDFGLVKVVAGDGSRLTTTGQLIGNLRYASPELLSGFPALDARSDLYSVGCLLHHLLAGTPPFPSKVATAVASGHLHESPPTLAELGVDTPVQLQALVSALLAKERENRPASATEVYGALGPWLPAPSVGPAALRSFGPEDPRRPFVLPQGPYPV